MKKHVFLIIYIIFIVLFTLYVFADGFLISSVISTVASIYDDEIASQEVKEENFTETSYKDNNISIEISTDRQYDSDIYIVEIKLEDIKYLKTAFAKSSYGKNISETTSTIASANHAILAINGDYYGFRENGYVVRNGITYRNTARTDDRDDYLIIYNDGNFKMGHEQETTLEEEQEIAEKEGREIWQVFTFGPALVEDGKALDNSTLENSNQLNPRMAIGFIDTLHYVIICCDGRTDESPGLYLNDFACYLADYGCKVAYNLDGGSSTTLYFNGEVINKPSNGFEREVSDNAGIFTLTVGSAVKGIFSIAGAYSNMIKFYFIVGVLLIIISLIINIKREA